jgi:hypothetical protein
VQNPVTPSAILTDLHYLPGLAFFANLLRAEVVWLEAHEHFQKQTYRNRCRIGTARGVEALVAPVLGGRSQHKVPMREVRLDHSTNWPTRHWRAIQTAYGRAPFFGDYAPHLQPLFERVPAFLFDFSLKLLTTCLYLLRMPQRITCTEQYVPTPPTGVLDLRNLLSTRHEAGAAQGYRPVPYRQPFGEQPFGEQFFSNLSVIDLLFCQGPQSLSLLRQSVWPGPWSGAVSPPLIEVESE